MGLPFLHLFSVFKAAAADKFPDDRIARDKRRVERRKLAHDLHQNAEPVRLDEGIVQRVCKLGQLAQVFCEDAQLIVVEGVDVDAGVRLVGRDILHLALVDRLR